MPLNLSTLEPLHKGTKKKAFRKGRGTASGAGKTAGKGQKGQNARSGGGVGPGFEGGQTKLARRLPKRGFTNHAFKKNFLEIKIESLNIFNDNDVVTIEMLWKEFGKSKNLLDGIKILGNGELLRKNITVKATAFTKSAAQKIETAGGKAEVV